MKTIEQKLDAENIELDFELEDLDDIAKIISVRVILTPSEPPASDSDTLVFVGNPVLSFESIEIAKKDRQGGSFEPFANIQEIGEFQQNGVRGFKGTLSDPDFPFQGDATIYRIIFNFSPDQSGVSDDASTSYPDDKSTKRFLEVNLFPKLEEQDLISKKFTDVADKAVYEFRETKNLGQIMEVSVQDLSSGDSETDVPTSGSILKSIEVAKRQDRRGSVFMPFETFELEMVNQIGGLIARMVTQMMIRGKALSYTPASCRLPRMTIQCPKMKTIQKISRDRLLLSISGNLGSTKRLTILPTLKYF